MGPGSGILHFVLNDNLAEQLALAHLGVTTSPDFQAATSPDRPQLAIRFLQVGNFPVSDIARSICRRCRQSHAALIIA
jgi:hypothetical protein